MQPDPWMNVAHAITFLLCETGTSGWRPSVYQLWAQRSQRKKSPLSSKNKRFVYVCAYTFRNCCLSSSYSALFPLSTESHIAEKLDASRISSILIRSLLRWSNEARSHLYNDLSSILFVRAIFLRSPGGPLQSTVPQSNINSLCSSSTRNMLWCQGIRNTGLSNHEFKYALKCTVWSQCTTVPERRTDRQTDEHHGNSARIH